MEWVSPMKISIERAKMWLRPIIRSRCDCSSSCDQVATQEYTFKDMATLANTTAGHMTETIWSTYSVKNCQTRTTRTKLRLSIRRTKFKTIASILKKTFCWISIRKIRKTLNLKTPKWVSKKFQKRWKHTQANVLSILLSPRKYRDMFQSAFWSVLVRGTRSHPFWVNLNFSGCKLCASTRTTHASLGASQDCRFARAAFTQWPAAFLPISETASFFAKRGFGRRNGPYFATIGLISGRSRPSL